MLTQEAIKAFLRYDAIPQSSLISIDGMPILC